MLKYFKCGSHKQKTIKGNHNPHINKEFSIVIMKQAELGAALREMCQNSEIFWFAFSYIRTEDGKILRISPSSVRIRENTDQNNSGTDTFYAVLNI